MRMRSILLLIVAMLAIHPHCYPAEKESPMTCDEAGEDQACATESENT